MSRRRVRACFVALLLLAGCEGVDPSARGGTTESGESALTAPEAAVNPPPVDLALERRLKAAEAAPLAVVRSADWATFEGEPEIEAGALPDDARAVLETVDVPVLVPRDPDLLATGLATSGDTWYGLSMTAGGHTVYLHATRTAQRPAVPLREAVPSPTREVPRVTSNEGIPVLSFEAWGVSYSLFVECEAPDTDPRCTDAAYVRELAAGLGRLGGGAP